MRPKLLLATSLVVFGCLGLSAPALSAGSVDRSFGSDGVVDLTPHIGPYPYASVTDMSIGPGGSIYLLDSGGLCSSFCGANYYLTKLRPNGSVNHSYANRGASTLLKAQNGAVTLAVDEKGRPVGVAGGEGSFTVLRLKPDGRRDGSFGTGGKVSIPCECRLLRPQVKFDAAGRIVVGGEAVRSGSPIPFQETLFVARLLPDGRLDPRFGVGGTNSWPLPEQESPHGFAVRPGGSLVVAGGGLPRPYLVGITRGGELDPGFGELASRAFDAFFSFSGLHFAIPWVLIPRSRGRIDILGSADLEAGYQMRLLPNGSLDREFSGDGLRLYDLNIWAAAADREGNVFAAGSTRGHLGLTTQWMRPSGRIVESFAGGGDSRLQSLDAIRAIVEIQKGGRPVLFDEGAQGCRSYCPPHPRLIRFTGVPHRHPARDAGR